MTSARGRFFFKRREEGCTPETVACDHALVRFLVERGFPTPPLLPTRDGATSVAWQGRLYEAYAWVEGPDLAPGDERQMAGLGRAVGCYHQLVAGYHPPHVKLPPWGDVSVSAYLDVGGYVASRWAMLAAHGRVWERETPFLRQAVAQLQAQAARVREEAGLVPLVVHGALEPGNILFGPDGEAIALVDWADADGTSVSAQFVRVYGVAHALPS